MQKRSDRKHVRYAVMFSQAEPHVTLSLSTMHSFTYSTMRANSSCAMRSCSSGGTLVSNCGVSPRL